MPSSEIEQSPVFETEDIKYFSSLHEFHRKHGKKAHLSPDARQYLIKKSRGLKGRRKKAR